MNIRSITMGQALETLAQQSRVVPTMIFRNPEEEEHFPDVMELEELPREDDPEDASDRFLQ